MTTPSPLHPPFTRDTAIAKVQAAEDAWNSRDPDRVAMACTEDSIGADEHRILTPDRSGKTSGAAR